MAEQEVRIRLTQQRDYQYQVDFGAGPPPLLVDESPPLGGDAGPNPVQLLLTAVGNCLAASLLFALRKFKLPLQPVRTEVDGALGREQGRLRVIGIDVRIELDQPVAESSLYLQRALDQFQGFCTVTESVGKGIPVRVKVVDANGRTLK
jgi:uncharacterized OsmC-like protein